jgi:hypothetical protein
VLLEERDRLIERIANEGPRAALQWARDESMARAVRGERLPEYCERLLSEPSSSDYDEDERKSKKRRVASPRHCAGGKEPVSFIVPLGEKWLTWGGVSGCEFLRLVRHQVVAILECSG